MIFYDPSGRRKMTVITETAGIGFVVLLLISLALMHAYTGTAHGSIAHTMPDMAAPEFEKTIALTFDDGPHPVYTPQLIELLSEEDVPATFFLLGANVARHPDIARDIVEAGLEIGNHTFSHAREVHDTRLRLQRELITTDRVILDATGRATILYRPPYMLDMDVGNLEMSPISNEGLWVAQTGYIPVGVTHDVRDWDDEDDLLNRMMGAVEDGGHIILLHDANTVST